MSSDPDPFTEGDRAPGVIALTATILSISSTAVFLRLYTRIFVLRAFGRDDFTLTVAWVLIAAFTSLVASNTRNGLGKHTARLDAEAVIRFEKTAYATNFIYQAAIPVIKLALLLQYLRAFPVGYIQAVSKATIVFITAWGISQLIAVILYCIPLRKVWEPTVPGTCINLLAFWYANAVVHILTDFLIFALPLPALWKLGFVTRSQRIVLVGVFALGFFTCAISIIRAVILSDHLLSNDANWDWANLQLWCIAELNSAIFCACIPTLRPLFTRHSSQNSSQLPDRQQRSSSKSRSPLETYVGLDQESGSVDEDPNEVLGSTSIQEIYIVPQDDHVLSGPGFQCRRLSRAPPAAPRLDDPV